jgi:hypothetical protein
MMIGGLTAMKLTSQKHQRTNIKNLRFISRAARVMH